MNIALQCIITLKVLTFLFLISALSLLQPQCVLWCVCCLSPGPWSSMQEPVHSSDQDTYKWPPLPFSVDCYGGWAYLNNLTTANKYNKRPQYNSISIIRGMFVWAVYFLCLQVSMLGSRFAVLMLFTRIFKQWILGVIGKSGCQGFISNLIFVEPDKQSIFCWLKTRVVWVLSLTIAVWVLVSAPSHPPFPFSALQ